MDQYDLSKVSPEARQLIEERPATNGKYHILDVKEDECRLNYRVFANLDGKTEQLYKSLERLLGVEGIQELPDYNFEDHVLGFSFPVYKQGFVRKSLHGLRKLEVKLHEFYHILDRYASEFEVRRRTRKRILNMGFQPAFQEGV